MMWFKREPKTAVDKENGVVGKLRRKKPVILKTTRESSERETSTESDKERRRYSDILDTVVSIGMYKDASLTDEIRKNSLPYFILTRVEKLKDDWNVEQVIFHVTGVILLFITAKQ